MEPLLPDDEDRTIEQERLEEVSRLPIEAVVAELVSIIGLKRTAVIGAVKDADIVNRWISEEQVPQRANELRAALRAARILYDADGAYVAKAWFSGRNHNLNFESPILVLRDNIDTKASVTILRAALEFVRR